MLPLKCRWIWTVRKAQGQTIKGKVVADLGWSEKEHGLTYNIFSGATIFSDFGIFNGITTNRLINSVFQHKKMEPRKAEERSLDRVRNVARTKLFSLSCMIFYQFFHQSSKNYLVRNPLYHGWY